MNAERKRKVIEYLYPSTQAIDFMFDDFYLELLEILPKKICFSTNNKNKKIRQKNLTTALKVVDKFLEENPIYKIRLKELYFYKKYSTLLYDVIVGYVLYLTPNINKGTGADVFLDSRSICYGKTSVIEWL